MLLPSAFSCDDGVAQAPAKVQRPKLQSFAAYQPQYSTSARPSSLSSSCRALQAILGGSYTRQSTTLNQQPIQRAPLLQTLPARREPETPRRSANKRRRSEFEEDVQNGASDILMEGCHTPEPARTPKRRRRVPLSMPLGLSADDFRALEVPKEEIELEMPPVVSPDFDDDSAYGSSGSSPTLEDEPWTDVDDRMLVDLVLEKMKLSRHAWNDCARRLGKDKDNLERRWTMLVGDGNVGLRRGGKVSRPNLDVASW